MKGIEFNKMHGLGNDFVFIDNRDLRVPVTKMPGWAVKLCDRKLGIGADGLVFIESAPEGSGADFAWNFYNADGSRAEMCGNASRCVSWLAQELGLAGPKLTFLTDAGLIRAECDYQNRFAKVALTAPKGLALNAEIQVEDREFTVHFVDTGVPHAVIVLPPEGFAEFPVQKYGRILRYHRHFQPAGANVNFISVKSGGEIFVRTYERGVEGETLACGTGAAASVYICLALGLTEAKVSVTTSGGEKLTIAVDSDRAGDVIYMAGTVERVFQGILDPVFISI